MGPKIGPCGTPCLMRIQRLQELLILTLLYLFVKQLCIKLNDAMSNSQACNFAIIRSCGKRSNALDRSASSAAYSTPWSSDFLKFFYQSHQTALQTEAFPETSLTFTENVFKKRRNLVIKNIFKDFRQIWQDTDRLIVIFLVSRIFFVYLE